MKKFITLCIGFCFILQANAQNYQTALDTSYRWSVIMFGACDAMCEQTFSITGDTTINGLDYKIFNQQYFVREDTVQGKIWCYENKFQHREFLISDLSLLVGDKFYIHSSSDSIARTVDSVYYQSNKKHVRLNSEIEMCGAIEKITFIEGTGTNAGLFYNGSVYFGTVDSYMLCHSNSTSLIYGNTFFADKCDVCETRINENSVKKFHIYPNPANQWVTIDYPLNEPLTLEVFDLTGKKIMTQAANQNPMKIAINNFDPGVYLMKLTSVSYEQVERILIK